MTGMLLCQWYLKKAGIVSSGILFNGFLIHFFCLLPEAYAWIERIIGKNVRDCCTLLYITVYFIDLIVFTLGLFYCITQYLPMFSILFLVYLTLSPSSHPLLG